MLICYFLVILINPITEYWKAVLVFLNVIKFRFGWKTKGWKHAGVLCPADHRQKQFCLDPESVKVNLVDSLITSTGLPRELESSLPDELAQVLIDAR